MTQARMVGDGWTTLITRRCVEQKYLLRPDRDGVVKNAYLYTLAHAAIETGCKLHAYVAMGNHSHVVQTDPAGERPRLAGMFHGLFARIMNVILERKSNFWCGSRSYNDLHCVEGEDVLSRMVYVVTNPVESGLVERPEDWPGAITLPEHYLVGAPPIVATRPSKLLRAKARRKGEGKGPRTARDKARAHGKPKEPLPPERQLVLAVPAPFRSLGRNGFAKLFRERVDLQLEQIAWKRERQADRKKRGYLGVEQIFLTNVNDSPKPRTAAELEAKKQQQKDDGLVPNIACKNPVLRAKARTDLCDFWKDNRRAYEDFRDGQRDVLFPWGTYGMARFQGARVADAG
jgi:putative transposase